MLRFQQLLTLFRLFIAFFFLAHLLAFKPFNLWCLLYAVLTISFDKRFSLLTQCIDEFLDGSQYSLTHSQALQPMQGLGRPKKPPPISLFLALALQFLTPIFSVSIVTPSVHLRFGLPARLLPSGLSKVIFLHGRLSCIRIPCPAHLSLVIVTHCGRVTQICVFTLQLCKTDDANLRF